MIEESYSSTHIHTDYSNGALGFPDCTIQMESLFKKAKELKLNAIAITDHEMLGGHYKALKMSKKYDVKCILGNEIYLQTDEQYEKDKEEYIKGETYYPHFILLALDEIGHKQIREISSIAWRENSYHSKGLLRRVTKFSDIEKVINNEKGHIFVQTACLGGYIARETLKLIQAKKEENNDEVISIKNNITNFIKWACDIFGKDNFAIEIQPNLKNTEQWEYNIEAIKIAKKFDLLCTVTTDAHYLSKEEAPIHEAFLKSKEEDDREVASFYKTAYLMDYKELYDYLEPNIGKKDTLWVLGNSNIIAERCKEINLDEVQTIPLIKPPEFTVKHSLSEYYDKYPILKQYAYEEDEQKRYALYRVESCAREICEEDNKYLPTLSIDEKTGDEILVRSAYTLDDMMARISEELTVMESLSGILNQPMCGYYLTMAYIMDKIWNVAESLVGAGRGSAGACLFAYLLEITQMNPLWYGEMTPFWRHMDSSKVSIADLDIDLMASKREEIMQVLKDTFGDKNVLRVATFGTLTAKNAIKTAGRGLKMNIDEYQPIADCVKVERGASYTISECLYGNEKKGKKPVQDFINLSKSYPELIEIALGLEGLILNRSEHACGIILTNKPYTELNCCMLSQSGNETTQFTLEDTESMGGIKYDFLFIGGLEKIKKSMDFLLKNNHIQWQGSLKKTYDYYFHPRKLDYNNKKVWDNIENIPFLFQYEGGVGVNALRVTTPSNLLDLSVANNLMRLAGEFDGKTNLQRFSHYKEDFNNWRNELSSKGLNENEIDMLEKHLYLSRGLCDTQERLMLLSMDKEISNFTLTEADSLRKVIAKKIVNKIPETKKAYYDKGIISGNRKELLDYVWDYQVSMSLDYSFSGIHSIAYSTIGLQEALIYCSYPSVYWATSCLIVDGGVNENVNNKSQDYGAIASALYLIMSHGTNIDLPNINTSHFGYEPVEKSNSILFGLKAINSVNDEQSKAIIENRPYTSFVDFLEKNIEVKLPKKTISNLIKSGSFDTIEKDKTRTQLMKEYMTGLAKADKKEKEKLTASNISDVFNSGLLEKEDRIILRYYNFNKFITGKDNFYEKIKNKQWLLATKEAKIFFEQHYIDELVEDTDYQYTKDGIIFCKTPYNKIYKKRIEKLIEKINTPEFLDLYNKTIFTQKAKEYYQKLATGSQADWVTKLLQ